MSKSINKAECKFIPALILEITKYASYQGNGFVLVRTNILVCRYRLITVDYKWLSGYDMFTSKLMGRFSITKVYKYDEKKVNVLKTSILVLRTLGTDHSDAYTRPPYQTW